MCLKWPVWAYGRERALSVRPDRCAVGGDRAVGAEPRSGGRPAVHPSRRIVDAILYVDRTGCAWRQLPHDFPPWATVFWYFKQWREDGMVDRLHDALRDRVRDAEGRDPMASAGCVDAQSVKGADTVGADGARVRRGQEGQRPQAAHRGRHHGPAAAGDDHLRGACRTATGRARCWRG